MVIDKINNLIHIIESKTFSNSFYEHYIYEEEIANSPMTPPSVSQSIKSKAPGLLMKGGLLAGGALLAHHTLQSNPELNHQIHELGRNVRDGVTHGVKSINTSAHEIGDKIKLGREAAAANANWNSNIHPKLDTAEDYTKHAKWLEDHKNDAGLTFKQREQMASHITDFAKDSSDKYTKQYIPNDIAKDINSSGSQYRTAEANKALEIAKGEELWGRNSKSGQALESVKNIPGKTGTAIANGYDSATSAAANYISPKRN